MSLAVVEALLLGLLVAVLLVMLYVQWGYGSPLYWARLLHEQEKVWELKLATTEATWKRQVEELERKLQTRKAENERLYGLIGELTARQQEIEALLQLKGISLTNPSLWVHLREMIEQYIGTSELRTLVFDLGADWDNLSGEAVSDKVVSLLQWVERHQKLSELHRCLARARPDVDW